MGTLVLPAHCGVVAPAKHEVATGQAPGSTKRSEGEKHDLNLTLVLHGDGECQKYVSS